ncbi:MAG: exosortase A [Francisellaceae bacterium]|jgi:exosortase A
MDDDNKTRNQWIIFSSLLIVSWVVLTYVGLTTAIKIWTVSDIFNHCYIVLPASFYLIWEKRNEIAWDKIKPSMLPIPLLIGQILVYLFGLAGDINVLMHIATFTMLPVIIWILVGTMVAKQIMFALCFMVFAIPIGEELVPFLQELTADYSVLLLQLTGIPLFRSGLYIEIPQGKFLVAEACSGISFLIASVVLGNLYAYMNLRRKRTRILFVLLSIAFPIFANIIRVYGIILIGYSSDMEYAVGADHLIYGWFFFAFVLVCLFLIGESIRRREVKKLGHIKRTQENEPKSFKSSLRVSSANLSLSWLLPLFIIGLSIGKSIALSTSSVVVVKPPFSISGETMFDNAVQEQQSFTSRQWEPSFAEASQIVAGNYKIDDKHFKIFTALYRPNAGELINSQNKIYGEKRWSRADSGNEVIDGLGLNRLYLSSSDGNYMRVYFLYIIGENSFTSKTHGKLYETWLTLLGEEFNTAFISISFAGEGNRQLDLEEKIIVQALYKNVSYHVKTNSPNAN